MNKYDKMIEENQRKSKEKICLAQQTIHDMVTNKERITVPKLMKKTGLSNRPVSHEPGSRRTGRNDRSKKRNPEHGNGKADWSAEPENSSPDQRKQWAEEKEWKAAEGIEETGFEFY